MDYIDRVRTCPHGMKHDPMIDSASICPECKKENEQRNKSLQCPMCSKSSLLKLGITKYCSNPECKDYMIYKVINLL
jgi:hypothetical protein